MAGGRGQHGPRWLRSRKAGPGVRRAGDVRGDPWRLRLAEEIRTSSASSVEARSNTVPSDFEPNMIPENFVAGHVLRPCALSYIKHAP